ncbi:MAG: DUF432 domain-containing protein, partial [Desulfurococcaceae archaeon]
YGKELSAEAAARLQEKGVHVTLEWRGAFAEYRRVGGFPVERVEKVIEGHEGLKTIVYPVHSIQVEVSAHLLLRLARPVVVAPKSKLAFYAKAPVSVGIYVAEGGSQKLVDSFGPSPYKYVLYGRPASGIVCRFHRTDVFPEPPQAGLEEAITKVEVESSTDDFVEVRNIVLPLAYASLYVDEHGGAYMEGARLTVRSDGVGTVFLENERPLAGLKECVPPPTRFLARTMRFVMEYGL